MKPEKVLTMAINTLTRWNDDVIETGERCDLHALAQIQILKLALNDVGITNGDKSKFRVGTREAIALAYAVLDIEDNV